MMTRVREAALSIAFTNGFAVQLALKFRVPLVTGETEIKAVETREPLEILWLPI